jgi:general secretion pathway protein G
MRQRGFTLLELLIGVVVLAIFTIIAIPVFSSAINCDEPDSRPGPLMRAKISQVISELVMINLKATRFETNNRRFPDSIEELGLDSDAATDAWGQPYVFTDLTELDGVGKARKDHNLHPVNKYFDVYSVGPDGETATPFTSTGGKDDLVMADDGNYFGFACHYNGSGKNK